MRDTGTYMRSQPTFPGFCPPTHRWEQHVLCDEGSHLETDDADEDNKDHAEQQPISTKISVNSVSGIVMHVLHFYHVDINAFVCYVCSSPIEAQGRPVFCSLITMMLCLFWRKFKLTYVQLCDRLLQLLSVHARLFPRFPSLQFAPPFSVACAFVYAHIYINPLKCSGMR